MKRKHSEQVTQTRTPKVSEGAARLRRKLARCKEGDALLPALEICLASNPKDLTAVIEQDRFELRKRLLRDFANLPQDGLAHFRKNIGAHYRQETEPFLKNVRRDLRRVWQAPLKEKQYFVDALIAASFEPGLKGWSAPLRLGRIVPDPTNLRSQLAIGILENWRRFRVCANPECVVPFFLARRKDQKYCEHGVCTSYAQRMYSKNSYYRTQKKTERRCKRGD
jgi:hypothetical protein